MDKGSVDVPYDNAVHVTAVIVVIFNGFVCDCCVCGACNYCMCLHGYVTYDVHNCRICSIRKAVILLTTLVYARLLYT